MEGIFIIGVIILLILALGSPRPRRQIVYVPVEVAEPQANGLGCLVLLVLGVAGMFLLALLNAAP